MRKILLIGSGGSGKSTLAPEIAARLGLPLVHLDALFWKPGWIETPKDEWRQIVAELCERGAWVMDGNYGGTLNLRITACDAVIFLDLPPRVCLWRVLKRWWRFRRRTRPDMGQDCPEHLSWKFLWWIWTYRKNKRPGILVKLATLASEGKRIFVLDSDAAVKSFVAQLPTSPTSTLASGR